ncbi:MAG: DNA repair protein [Clostridiaceae bacterium]|nr:DNA repair protein [Clostridiaceae bacterium]
MNRFYLCIDLKSFYASVECVERGLDPMTTNLVVADPERSDKTICLAITPAMKALGIPNRCRVFEIPRNVKYITAPPRMQKYIDYSASIYGIYLKYISSNDIHVYSIDEAFLDITEYLSLYQMTPQELGRTILDDIYEHTGIRATCGIGTNLYLAKIALDITAKHAPDFMAFLDEEAYRRQLWNHRPITDFWRIGKGIARQLESCGIHTMKGIADADETVLYHKFGIDAELLIDHAWGREPVTIADIKAYRPSSNCLSSGQVLMKDYEFESGKLIVKEMMDSLCLEMVDQKLVTSSVTLHVGYAKRHNMPSASGTVPLSTESNADMVLIPAIVKLYENIINPACLIRRITITCNRVIPEEYRQYSLFDDAGDLQKNRKLQETVISIKKRFGKNAILRGMDLQEDATAQERNRQIGGHKSGEEKTR